MRRIDQEGGPVYHPGKQRWRKRAKLMSDEQPIPPDPLTPTEPAAPRPRKKMGRPRREINWEIFDALAFAHCTLEEFSLYLQVNERTLERACRREFGQTFADIYRAKSARSKVSLRKAMWDAALRGRDTRMQIWLSKQYLGMREALTMDITETYPITAEIEALSLPELERQIRDCLAGIDWEKRMRRHEKKHGRKVIEAESEPAALPAPAASAQPVPAQDVAALNAEEESKKEKG